MSFLNGMDYNFDPSELSSQPFDDSFGQPLAGMNSFDHQGLPIFNSQGHAFGEPYDNGASDQPSLVGSADVNAGPSNSSQPALNGADMSLQRYCEAPAIQAHGSSISSQPARNGGADMNLQRYGEAPASQAHGSSTSSRPSRNGAGMGSQRYDETGGPSSSSQHANISPGTSLQPYYENPDSQADVPSNSSQHARKDSDIITQRYIKVSAGQGSGATDGGRDSSASQAGDNTDGGDRTDGVVESSASRGKGSTVVISDQELIIRSEEEFIDELGKRIREDRGRKKRNILENGDDVDFPTTDAEKLECIQKLVDAMKNTTDILDKPCKDGKPAQAAQRFDRGYYPDKEIELAAWTVLFGLRDAQMGVILVELHHGYKYEQYASFEARFKAVASTLRQSKATCKQLLDPHYVDRLCDAPDVELQMKLSNKKVNAQRDTQNQIGRQVLAGELDPDTIAKLKTEEAPATPHTRRALKTREAPEGKLAILTPKPVSRKKTGASASKTKSGSTARRKASSKIKKEVDEDDIEPDFEEDDEDDFNDDTYYATPRSSSKRKRQPVIYTDDVEESDGDDSSYHPSLDTPTKKARSSTRRRGAIDGPSSGGSLRQISGTNTYSSPYSANPLNGLNRGYSNMGQPSNSPASAGLPHSYHGLPTQMGQHTGALGFTGHKAFSQHDYPSPLGYYQYSTSSSTNSSLQSAATGVEAETRNMDVNKKDRYDVYRDTVCGLLQINPEDGKNFTLTELRRYARGYNQTYSTISYSDPETPGWSFVDHKAFLNGTTVEHFALVHPRMMSIAKLRGDMDAAGRYVPFPANGMGFRTFSGNDDRAVGAADNEFGVPHYLYPEPPRPIAAPPVWNPAQYGGSGNLFSDHQMPSRK